MELSLSLPRWKELQDKPVSDATEEDLFLLASNPIFKAAKDEAWRRILQSRHSNPEGVDPAKLNSSLLVARGIETAFEIFESFSPTKRSGEKNKGGSK